MEFIDKSKNIERIYSVYYDSKKIKRFIKLNCEKGKL